jgi:serine/threonine protein kinase
MADRMGQHIGNYHLQRLLGEGGFAEVYLGEHVHLRTLAAIKLLSTRLHSEEIERFRAEAETLAHLKHPHIVKVFDFGVEGGVPFLVMDYAAGGSLRQRHPKGTRLSPTTILPYVRQVTSALRYAHERKLIHRDVKPENMLLGDSEEVLLSDFGIATLSQSSRYQSTQDVGGTLAYMAPEQIQGHPRPASDQYSLGIVLYEWLTGKRPFTGLMGEVVAQHLSTPPPPLREQLPDLSPGLEQVVLTALEKDPKQRFATIQAFANAFEQACQPDPSFLSPTVRGLLPELPPLFAEPTFPPAPPQEEQITPLSLDPPALADEPAGAAPLPPSRSVLEPVVDEPAGAAPAGIALLPTSPKQTGIWTQGFALGFVLAALAGGVLTLIGAASAHQSTNPTGDQVGILVSSALLLVCLLGLGGATTALMRIGFAFQLFSAIAGILVWAVVLSYDANSSGSFPYAVYSHLVLAVNLLRLVSLLCVSYALVHWQRTERAMTVVQLLVSIFLTALFSVWFTGGNVSFAPSVSRIEYVAIFACAAFPAALLGLRIACWRRQPVVILCLAGASGLWVVFQFNLPLTRALSDGLVLASVSLTILGFLALAQVERVKKAAPVR